MSQIVAALHPLLVPTRDSAGNQLTGATDFTAEEMRRWAEAMRGRSSGPIGVGELAVSALGTPGAQVLVAPGRIWIPNSFSTNGGVYLVILNSQGTLDVPAADASQQRNDAVYAEVQDQQYDTSGTYAARIRYLQNGTLGSGAAYPTPSPASSNYMLSQVRVPAGGTTVVDNAHITNVSSLAGRSFNGGRLTQNSNIGQFTGAASSYLGQMTTTGPPTSGTYVAGDWGFDSNMALWACTASGTPGTWIEPGATWTQYTPTWTASSTNPSIGNGTMFARYRIMGKTLMWRLTMIMGSTTTFGSGTWQWSLPSGAAVPSTSGGNGIGRYTADNLSTLLDGITLCDATNTTTVRTFLTSTNPFTWASGHKLTANMLVELN